MALYAIKNFCILLQLRTKASSIGALPAQSVHQQTVERICCKRSIVVRDYCRNLYRNSCIRTRGTFGLGYFNLHFLDLIRLLNSR